MAVKMALALGLFIVICGPPGLKSSQVVPDGLVYTEAKKTLVQGVQGVLTCRFFGDPSAVYWRKRLNPDELSLMVLWLDGEVSGPRYDDGSCDVDENYSLIINNVSTADSGRMYCTVSNNKGPLMNNYTDILVVDTAITTNPLVTLQLRQAIYGILQCTVHIKARRVSWMKGTTSSANESLVVMESNTNVSERSGNGYDDGKYNITQEYSLVIKELQIHHEGLYVCEVTDDTGISFRNHTFVNVVAQPLEPFPTIQECLHTEQHDSNYCILVAKSGMTLTCQVVKYYPSINLLFLYGSKVLQPSDTTEWDNTDGTYNKTIRIAPSGNKELYSCVASSVPGTNANKSTSVLLQGDETVLSTMVVILVCLLPTLRGPYIYKAELVDLAFHLLMQDLSPVAKELGINVTRLVSYRPVFSPSHLECSTINLLIELYASIGDTSLTKPERLVFCRKIANSKYDSDAITGMFEYNMSYGELCSISEAITQNLEERDDQGATSSMLPGPGIPDPLRILQDVLQLTDQDIADRLDTSHPLTAYALFKIWKEKPRPSVFNYRAALAHGIRRIQMTGLADQTAAGKYMKGRTSLVFIEDMVRGLNQDQLGCLRKLLNLSGTPSYTISEEICAWVQEWTTEMEIYRKSRSRKERVKTGGTLTVPGGGLIARMTKSTRESQLSESNIPHDHRDLNDRLVHNGFLDLAREIMIIEQRSLLT